MVRGTWRRRRSPTGFTCGVRAWAAWWPESFPAVPCRSPVRPRDRLETQASQLGDLDIGIHASRVVRRDVVQARCRRSGDNSPGSPNLVDPAPRREPIRPVAVVDRVVPPATRRTVRTGRISCSAELFPAVPRRSKICGKWNFPLAASKGVVYDVVAGERRGVGDRYGHRVILRVLWFSREETRWPRRTV